MIGFVHKAQQLRATRRYLIACRAWELREADRIAALPTTPDRVHGIQRRRERARDLSAALIAIPYIPSMSGFTDLDDPTPEAALADFVEDEWPSELDTGTHAEETTA